MIFDALGKQCAESSWHQLGFKEPCCRLGLGALVSPSFGNPKAPSKSNQLYVVFYVIYYYESKYLIYIRNSFNIKCEVAHVI